MTGLIKGDRDYLRSLVRMDVRKKERGLLKMRPRPNQSTESFSEIYNKQLAALEFRQSVLSRLEEEPK